MGVRVTDSDGGIRVQYFGISLLNESPALVDTLAPATSSADSVVLRGTITDPGCVNGVDQVGFLISKDPIVEFEQDGVNKFMVEVDENGTSFDFTHQIANKEEIYYRAYAINVEGVSMSLEETFTPEKSFNHTRFLPPLKKPEEGIGGKVIGLENFMEILKMDGFIITLMGGYLPCRAQTKEFGYGLTI